MPCLLNRIACATVDATKPFGMPRVQPDVIQREEIGSLELYTFAPVRLISSAVSTF
jgi:hypothetical protein